MSTEQSNISTAESDSYRHPTSTLDLLRQVSSPAYPKLVVFAILTTIAAVGWNLAPWAVSEIVDHVADQNPINSTVWVLVAIFFAGHLVDEVGWRYSDYLVRSFLPELIERTRNLLFAGVHQKKHSFMKDSSSGRLGHWINQTSGSVANIYEMTLWDTWRHITNLVASAVILAVSAHWSLTLLFVCWLVLIGVFNISRGRAYKPLVSTYMDDVSEASGIVVDSISNHLAVKTNNAYQHEISKLEDASSRVVVNRKKAWIHNLVTNAVKGNSVGLTQTAALALIIWLYSQGEISIGSIVLFVAYFRSAAGSVWELSWTIDEYFGEFGSIQNALDGLEGPSEGAVGSSKVNAELDLVPSITFDDVSFAYEDQPDLPVIEHIQLDIEPGQKLGLVGVSGSGKSTIVSLLLGLHKPQSGTIKLGDVRQSEMPLDQVRSLISYVPQETNLFNRHVADNVRYGSMTATDEEVEEALRKAQALEFVEALPEGINSVVGERGVKLSGGQRQRIGIARAILRDAPILVLDEASSALDTISEQAIQVSLQNLMEDRTAVVIAHRLSTLQHLDKIAVIEEGRITEQGSHDELLAADGIYADLWRRQKDGFIGA